MREVASEAGSHVWSGLSGEVVEGSALSPDSGDTVGFGFNQLNKLFCYLISVEGAGVGVSRGYLIGIRSFLELAPHNE